jgi:hypothetical protein
VAIDAMKPWFVRHPRRFEEVRIVIETDFPTLHLVVGCGVVFIRGTLALEDPETNRVISRFQVELEFPGDYPKSDPIVRETGGALPKIADRHFYDDGSACLFLPDARWQHCSLNCPIGEFIKGPVIGFFIWQAHVELTGQQPASGEWKHGAQGIMQFYSEALGTQDLDAIVSFLRHLAARKIRRHHRCFCGSGRPVGECHFDKVRFYRQRIDRRTALRSMHAIRSTWRVK